MKKREIRLYNVIFPMWAFWLVPPVIVVSLVGNWFIDLLAVVLTLRHLQTENRKRLSRDVIWRIYGCGFLADFIGTALLWISSSLAPDGFYDLTFAVGYNPLRSIGAFAWVTAGIAAAAVCIYFFDRKLALKNAALTEAEKHKLALSMAVFTAPYLFYLPMEWFF